MGLRYPPYVIRVVSKKGGVGKTVVAINLAIAIASFRKAVLLDDGDVANASVSIHLGVSDKFHSSQEVLYGDEPFEQSIYHYDPGGIDILPGTGMSTLREPPTQAQIDNLGKNLAAAPYEFVIIDTSPGFFIPQIARHYKEALIVSTLDEPSIASNVGLVKLYSALGVKTNLVLNKVSNFDDKKIRAVEKAFGVNSVGVLPEDPIVQKSIDQHVPAILLDKDSKFSTAIRQLAQLYYVRES